MARICSDCGMHLDDSNHDPCPSCGSIKRTITLVVHDLVQVTEISHVTLSLINETASLLLQSVIIPGIKTNEGQLIEAVAFPWFDIIELLSRNPSLAFQIDSRKWEEIIAGAYHRAKFDEVTLTPRSGDLGRDIIAVKRGIGTIRIIDQMKAYSPNHLVTANDVRALLGVLEADKASKGFLTTTSDFAPKLVEDILLKPFIPARLELINGNMLLTRLKELANTKPNNA